MKKIKMVFVVMAGIGNTCGHHRLIGTHGLNL